MSQALPEPRTAVMIVVEASWADQNGVPQAVSACVEDKSAGGACIRTKTPIGVGSKLRVQGRWEQITGVAKYCRRAGNEYFVGIQRDPAKNLVPAQPIPVAAPMREVVGSVRSSPALQIPQPEPQESTIKESQIKETEVAEVRVEAVPDAIASLAGPINRREEGFEISSSDRPNISQPQDAAVMRSTELEIRQLPKAKEIGKERKPMQRKWSELIHRHVKQDEVHGRSDGKTNGKATLGLLEGPVVEGAASFHIELLPAEDIYRTAGIVNLRRGYSISKVVEMLRSEHGRGLSKDAKRAAVLMALDAAGIPIDEVLHDAKARRSALDSYEAEVRKEVEAEWAQKAEENVQIQAELERVKAHYMARIGRNQEGVAREKTVFNNWLTMKQQESQSISEAAELCSKSGMPEPARGLLPTVSAAAAGAKPA